MIYLDYNATAPLTPAVKDAMQAAMALTGNPSSVHQAGRLARRVIETARQQIADLIACDPTFITFTSGATEANNTVLRQAPVDRLLISSLEHPSVREAADVLHTQKDITLIPATPDGIIDLMALEHLLAADTRPTLVSVMLANNETGVIQPIEHIAALAKQHGALLHADGVQALGKMPLVWNELGVDYLSLSAHKMGGPAGVGALVYDHAQPVLRGHFGGGQERRRRGGTENLIGIVGFGAACIRAACIREACKGAPQDDYMPRLHAWHTTLEQRMTTAIPTACIFGQHALRLGNVTQIALPGVTADKQLMALDLAGFAVSSGSACSSGSIKPSHVLQAMGVPDALASCAIRISSGWATSEDEIVRFADAWLTIMERLKG